MKIFKDPELKEEILLLDLGIVKAGERKEFSFYVENDTIADLTDLKFSVAHKEVEIISHPEALKTKEVGSLRLAWQPAVTLKQGLKTELDIKGFEIYS